jgi:hypothetical protein
VCDERTRLGAAGDGPGVVVTLGRRLDARFEASLHKELSAWMWRSVGVTASLLAAFAALITL